jgi:outer membrane lipopolysaccharide assembly protein LptE/RlpB
MMRLSMRLSIRNLSLVALMLVAVLQSSCGFALRGTSGLAEYVNIVDVRTSNVFIRDELESYLREDGIKIAKSGDAVVADAILQVGSEIYEQRVLSVSPDTGKAREYEIAYVFSYSFIDSGGQPLIVPGSVKLLRDFVVDIDQVIGNSRELGVLNQEMRRDAIQQLIRRIEAGLKAR